MKRSDVLKGFYSAFGGKRDDGARVFFAPLRVNLIGEYTDIAGGLVLPCALNIGIYAAARKRGDGLVRIKSASFPDTATVDLRNISHDNENSWADYQIGVFNELLKGGFDIGGLDFYDVSGAAGLSSAGLSSSAAIEVLAGVVMDCVYKLKIPGPSMAVLCQRAENEFVGVKCGIMDQFASRMGKKNNAVLLDCNTLEFEYIPARLNESGLSLIIMNTNKKRGLLDSKYNERRSEAERALKNLVDNGVIPDGDCLCSIGEGVFLDNQDLISDHVCRKRARHIVLENERVKKAANALKRSDFAQFGQLLNLSHKSLRDDFEVTGKELDAIAEAAWEFGTGCLGARMTGAGFGGCGVALVKSDCADEFIDEVSRKYTEKTGIMGGFYVCAAGDGAGEII